MAHRLLVRYFVVRTPTKMDKAEMSSPLDTVPSTAPLRAAETLRRKTILGGDAFGVGPSVAPSQTPQKGPIVVTASPIREPRELREPPPSPSRSMSASPAPVPPLSPVPPSPGRRVSQISMADIDGVHPYADLAVMLPDYTQLVEIELPVSWRPPAPAY